MCYLKDIALSAGAESVKPCSTWQRAAAWRAARAATSFEAFRSTLIGRTVGGSRTRRLFLVRFTEIVNRLNGISCPVFGVQWTPPVLDVTVARRVMRFLEDRRALYNPFAWEEPGHCVESVLGIRRLLTEGLGNLPPTSELSPHLRAIRSACRKFLDVMQDEQGGRRVRLHYHGSDSFGFYSAPGEFRGAIGPHVAAIAVQYGIDVEDDLARVLPAADGDQKSA